MEQVLGAYRLLRATPDQIATHWAFVRDALLCNMPFGVEPTEEVMANIQQALLAGRAVCWVLTETEKREIHGVCTTVITHDSIANTRNLLLYSVWAAQPIPTRIWRYCYQVMRKYAAANGCDNLVARTNSPRVLRLVKMLGGDVEQRMIQLEVAT